jgi:DNA-binding CsgD family transcriptional regulator
MSSRPRPSSSSAPASRDLRSKLKRSPGHAVQFAEHRGLDEDRAADLRARDRYLLLGAARPTSGERVSLTSREREIARIARGHTNRTIASVLEISPWTVSTHLRRIFAKLDVSSRAAMVGLLALHGVIDERAGRPHIHDSTGLIE